MLSGFLPSTLPCSKTQAQFNSLIQQNAKILAATGNYDLRTAQDLQKIVAMMSGTLQEVLTVSRTTLQQKLAEITLLEEKGQRQPATGEARASQQQPASTKTNLAANLAAAPYKNETRAQQDTSPKDSQKIYAGERTSHSETLDETLRYQDDAQYTLASSKNGAEDSADQYRRSKTYLTEEELEKIINGKDSTSSGSMNYSATSYSLNEETTQKAAFSATSFGVELNDRTRYRLDLSDDQFSLERSQPYSVNTPGTTFSPKNTMGWLMRVFQEITDTALEVLQLLGQKAERSTAIVRQVTKASKDIKAALEKVGENGTWKWGDQKYENGNPVFDEDGNPVFVPKKEYESIFRTMREQGITIDGMDVLDWLQKRSKPSEKKDLWTHLSEEHGYNPSFWERLEMGWDASLSQRTGTPHYVEDEAKKLAGCKKSHDVEMLDIKEGEISKGDLLRLSSVLDDAVVERNDANSKLQGQLTAQTQLYQSFQNAVINVGFIIAELMKSAFVKMPI